MHQQEVEANQIAPAELPQWETPELQVEDVVSSTLSGGSSNADGLTTFSS